MLHLLIIPNIHLNYFIVAIKNNFYISSFNPGYILLRLDKLSIQYNNRHENVKTSNVTLTDFCRFLPKNKKNKNFNHSNGTNRQCCKNKCFKHEKIFNT